MEHRHDTAEESAPILERLRILDEIDSIESDLRTARQWAFTAETAELETELAELTAQLTELDV